MKRLALLSLLLFALVCPAAQNSQQSRKASARPLRIYFVDVEGGAATLVVTPAGESLLFDCGWPRPDARDAKRIVAAAHELGVERIDYLVITHYHVDHWGGVADLAKLIPIGKFYDHGGRSIDLVDDKTGFAKLDPALAEASKGQTQKLSAGDAIKLRRAAGSAAISLDVLVASGETRRPANSRPNPQCVNLETRPEDPTENARSIGSLLAFGKFRFLDLGDITWNVEQKLVCPTDLIGNASLYQVTHHGLNISNNPVLLRTIHPQVAVMNNGARKGGSPEVVTRLRDVPGVEDIYQLHRNVAASDQENVAPEFIANLGQERECAGYGVKVEVAPNGNSYTVTNTRTGGTKTYTVR